MWSDFPSSHLFSKLISVSSFMIRWGNMFLHKFREKVKTQKMIIVRLVDRTDDNSVGKYLVEKNKLNDILFYEKL